MSISKMATSKRAGRRGRLAVVIAIAITTSLAGIGVLVNPLTAMAAAGPKPSAKAVGADVVKLKWTAMSGAVRYQVRYSTSSKMSKPTTVTKVDGADITKPFTNISWLSAKKTYYFQVMGFNAGGTALNTWGNRSSGAKTFYSYATPSGLSPTNLASTWMELSWQAVSGSPGYKVRYAGPEGTRYLLNQISPSGAIGLEANRPLRKSTKYKIRVAVQQPPIGQPGTVDYIPPVTMSRYSKEISVTTSGYPIAAPTNVQISQQKPDRVTVSWDAPKGITAAMKYRVDYSLNEKMTGARSADVASSSTSVVVTGMANNTNYYVRVKAIRIDSTVPAKPVVIQMSDRSSYQLAKTRIPRGTIKGAVGGAPVSAVAIMVYALNGSNPGEMVAQADPAGGGAYSAAVRPGRYKVLVSYLGSAGYRSAWVKAGAGNGVKDFAQADIVTVSSSGVVVQVQNTTLVR
ncbi:MAG: fibronectin type III domain-containing protein [Propionicimonas sp.]